MDMKWTMAGMFLVLALAPTAQADQMDGQGTLDAAAWALDAQPDQVETHLAPSEAAAALLPPELALATDLTVLDDAPAPTELAGLLAALGSDSSSPKGKLTLLNAAQTWRSATQPSTGSASAGLFASVHGGASARAHLDVDLPPVLAVSLGCSDDVYTQDYRFLIDVCGNDTYLNNAGGNGAPGACAPQFGSAALLDLSGQDTYGDAASPRDCGANGGGLLGSGFLYDGGGQDRYIAGSQGTNGGADGPAASGMLVDESGDDVYTAGSHGTNGGGHQIGAGLLVDGRGDDVYTAGHRGTNGGSFGAAGALVDLAGVDAHTAIAPGPAGAWGTGVNGGVVLGGTGTGLLLDVLGVGDTYTEDLPGSGDPTVTTTDATDPNKGQQGQQVDLRS